MKSYAQEGVLKRPAAVDFTNTIDIDSSMIVVDR